MGPSQVLRSRASVGVPRRGNAGHRSASRSRHSPQETSRRCRPATRDPSRLAANSTGRRTSRPLPQKQSRCHHEWKKLVGGPVPGRPRCKIIDNDLQRPVAGRPSSVDVMAISRWKCLRARRGGICVRENEGKQRGRAQARESSEIGSVLHRITTRRSPAIRPSPPCDARSRPRR